MKSKVKMIFAASVMAFALATFVAQPVVAQEGTIAPAENLVVDGVPAIPASLAETAGRYGSYRSAILADWHPTRREMLIATRFGDVDQLHLLQQPLGERRQLTFLREPITQAAFSPDPITISPFARGAGSAPSLTGMSGSASFILRPPLATTKA